MDIRIAASRKELGRMAARDVAEELRFRLAHQEQVRMVFAAAPSQSETLEALIAEPGIEWSRVVAFHMDEYVGLPEDAPQRFALWLRRSLQDHISSMVWHFIDPGNDPEAECLRYAELIEEAPIDMVLCGIGENGHLAFNDPPAVMDDPRMAKVVVLDEACRQQQVHDGCFANLHDVPLHAITLTIPALLGGKRLYCSVPGHRKRAAVTRMLREPVSGACPATALREHPGCVLYLDHESEADLH
jgi:glucosamine-6-phosphate deaminase